VQVQAIVFRTVRKGEKKVKRFYDYHVELERPDGYKDSWDAVKLSQETALQVSGMAENIGMNATEDMTATLRIFGNYYDEPKAHLVACRYVRIFAGVNTSRANTRKTILEFIKTNKSTLTAIA
jgi:hypothetical protein